jgi:hypothetical protein
VQTCAFGIGHDRGQPTLCEARSKEWSDWWAQNRSGTSSVQDVHGSDGAKIGTARQVYADDQTGQPEWVTVRTGQFGTKETFIPLAEADASADPLREGSSAVAGREISLFCWLHYVGRSAGLARKRARFCFGRSCER